MKKGNNEPIDFVIIWVDGNDQEWQKEKSLYKHGSPNIAMESGDAKSRYRDWDNLRYWFRAIEKFTPWVRKVHFVTWGHLPSWLNTNNPKLNIVNHKDFIPENYLPTFNSHTIELNLHRINGLSENFVYFNDDMFIIDKMSPTDFFRNGVPCQSAILDACCVTGKDTALAKIFNMGPINRNFNKKEVIKSNFFKWFNFKYGKLVIKNICLYPFKYFSGFYEQHLPNAFCKATYEDLWNKEFETLNYTCEHKFRDIDQVSQWLVEDWQLLQGNFIPRNVSIGKAMRYKDNKKDLLSIIKNQNYKMICIHDSDDIEDFDKAKEEVINAFENILPDKGDFENDK